MEIPEGLLLGHGLPGGVLPLLGELLQVRLRARLLVPLVLQGAAVLAARVRGVTDEGLVLRLRLLLLRAQRNKKSL